MRRQGVKASTKGRGKKTSNKQSNSRLYESMGADELLQKAEELTDSYQPEEALNIYQKVLR